MLKKSPDREDELTEETEARRERLHAAREWFLEKLPHYSEIILEKEWHEGEYLPMLEIEDHEIAFTPIAGTQKHELVIKSTQLADLISFILSHNGETTIFANEKGKWFLGFRPTWH